MGSVRCGVIGLGNMGSFYAEHLANDDIAHASLTAVCDHNPARLEKWPNAEKFADPEELLKSDLVDAVIIATPHYAHTTIGIMALEQGLHVLVEKPISVHKSDAVKLIAAHRNPKQIFAAMFNQRTDNYFLKIKDLITRGELGELRRVNWIITNWFRSDAYYASSAWRATWAGEGGGVLLNQCPHQLDMLCWLVGTPSKVEAHCHFGKYHDIEVEDEVTAYLEYPNGCTGVFITSTGEAPGTNRLEVCGEKGKVVFENDKLIFFRNKEPMSEFSRTSPDKFATPALTVEEFSGLDHGDQHLGIIRNFVAAITDGAGLIAPAEQGLASVELANAMLLSSFEHRAVDLPINAEVYATHLNNRAARSEAKKKTSDSSPTSMSGSFR
jgi:predicted dehydrogenase